MTSPPENIAELQNASSENDPEAARHRRLVKQRTDEDRSGTNSARSGRDRFRAQRHMVDRQLRDLAQKIPEIARLNREVEDRHRKIAEAEQLIEFIVSISPRKRFNSIADSNDLKAERTSSFEFAVA